MPEALCGICGREKRATGLVCPRCYELYRKEAPKLLAKGQAMDLFDWAKTEALKILSQFEGLRQALNLKKEQLANLQREVQSETDHLLTQNLQGKHLEPDIVKEARATIRKEVWGKKGGNRLYAEMMSMERELEQKTSSAQALLDAIEQERKKNGEKGVDRLIQSALHPKKG